MINTIILYKMAKPIKLVYDKYENDFGFSYDSDITKDHIHEIIKDVDKDRKINILTWGVKKHTSQNCDIIFDATLFFTKIDTDVKKLTGLDDNWIHRQ